MFLLLALLVIVPIIELFAFVQVASWIGVFEALFLLLALSVFGAWLVKVQGVGVIRRIGDDLNARQIPALPIVDGALLLVAGLLILIPGFVTDVFGLLLLVPVVRDAAGNALLRRWTRKFTVRRIGYGSSYRTGPSPTYDVGPTVPPSPQPGPARELEA